MPLVLVFVYLFSDLLLWKALHLTVQILLMWKPLHFTVKDLIVWINCCFSSCTQTQFAYCTGS